MVSLMMLGPQGIEKGFSMLSQLLKSPTHMAQGTHTHTHKMGHHLLQYLTKKVRGEFSLLRSDACQNKKTPT